MNIRFQNLGKIKETQLELKPMTVIIGPNNSNKTYIAYSIYGLWQSMWQRGPRLTRRRTLVSKEKNGAVSISVEGLLKEFNAGTQAAVKGFELDLENFYQDSSQALFSKTRFEVEFSQSEFEVALASLSGTKIGTSMNEYIISVQDNKLYLTPSGQREVDAGEEEMFPYEAASFILNLLRRRMVFQPYLMPAERNAFVITYKVLANRRLKLE